MSAASWFAAQEARAKRTTGEVPWFRQEDLVLWHRFVESHGGSTELALAAILRRLSQLEAEVA